MTETWRPVARQPAYEVSDLGRVRRIQSGRILKPTQNFSRGGRRPGYYKVSLGRKTQAYVHQLVCEAFHGPAPAQHDADHEDFDRANNTAANLRWMPMRENRMRWTPDGFVSKKHDDRENPPEGLTPMTDEERDALLSDLARAGWTP